MIRVCRRASAKHGLLMNFSKGKTECILRPFGDGSQDEPRVITVDDVVVRVVRSCKHVGCRGAGVGPQTPNSARSCKCLRCRHCFVVSDCGVRPALLERGRRNSVPYFRMRAARRTLLRSRCDWITKLSLQAATPDEQVSHF